MTVTGNFLHTSTSKSLKSMKCDTWLLGQFPLHFFVKSLEHDLFLLGTFSFRPPYQNHWFYNSLSQSFKCDTWLLQAIPCTTLYQNQLNMTNYCYDLLLPGSKKIRTRMDTFRAGWTSPNIRNSWFDVLSSTLRTRIDCHNCFCPRSPELPFC